MRKATRNVCVTFAAREVTGRLTVQPSLPRQTLSFRHVFRQDVRGVLLGFSSDGNFLVYCIDLDVCYEVQWSQVQFQDFYNQIDGGNQPKFVFRLRIDKNYHPFMSSFLEIWQSVDNNVVLAITIDNWTESHESPRSCHLVVAPSPMFDKGGLAATITSLSFKFEQSFHAQRMEKWQLMQLVPDEANVYHLLVNMATGVHVLVFHARRMRNQRETELRTPRGLGISFFSHNAWYHPPVFPIKFTKTTEYRQHNARSDSFFTTDIECLCQHLFDIERFVEEFLKTFGPLRHYNLVDYDLRLVRASELEKTVFMTCVLALSPLPLLSDGPLRQEVQCLRVALFLSLDLFTGIYYISRVLKVPVGGNLCDLSQVVARNFLVDVNARIIVEPAATTLNNDAFLREEPLDELINPVYPLSVSRTERTA